MALAIEKEVTVIVVESKQSSTKTWNNKVTQGKIDIRALAKGRVS